MQTMVKAEGTAKPSLALSMLESNKLMRDEETITDVAATIYISENFTRITPFYADFSLKLVRRL